MANTGSKSKASATRAKTSAAPAKRAAKPASARKSGTTKSNGRAAPQWDLRLYVAGQSPKSMTAFQNLKKICEERLQGEYRIEVIDLLAHPQLAKGDQILAIPTLVRKLPTPIKKIIGDLSNTERTLVGLDLLPAHQVAEKA